MRCMKLTHDHYQNLNKNIELLVLINNIKIFTCFSNVENADVNTSKISLF